MIVSDATALIVLLNLERLALLEIFNKVYIVKNVYDEITAHKRVELPPNFEVVECKDDLYFDLLTLLDPGESESIAFAKKMDLPLLIDEKKGRRVAKDLGVNYFGLIGLLCLLIRKGTLAKEEALALLDEAVAKGFRISQKLRRDFIEKC